MQQVQELSSFLSDCVVQLDIRAKDFKAKAEANKKKKGGAKNDNSKRSADQVEEHKKIIQRLQKVVQKDMNYENEHVALVHQGRSVPRTERHYRQVSQKSGKSLDQQGFARYL